MCLRGVNSLFLTILWPHLLYASCDKCSITQEMIPMKPLIPLLLLAVLVLASAGCVQPQIPEPYPTPVPTVQPASAEESAFWISNTDQYLSYWNEKMGWNTLTHHGNMKGRATMSQTTVSSSMPSKGFSVSPKNSLLHSLPQTLHKRKLTK